MTGNNHFIFGACVGASASLLLNCDVASATTLISTCLIGSIFPDIDNPTSHFGQLTKPVSSIIGVISKFFGKTDSKHRGIFHDGFVYALGAVLTYLYAPFGFGFFVGALSHLFLDCFNPSGIPVFLGLRHIHLGKIPSDSNTGTILTVFLSVVVVAISIVKRVNLL